MTGIGTMDQTAAPLDRVKPSAELMLRVVDGLIAALIFVLPFIMGGREAWGHWFLITTAFLLATAWSAYAVLSGARYAFSWLEYFFLAGLAIAWFQVQSQSPETLQAFSPEYTRLLSFWPETQPADSAWTSLSFTPRETRHGFWVFVAYSLIGIVVFQRARTMRDCERLLKYVGTSGLAMTVFGLWQWGLSNGNFFWFYEHPYTDTTVHLKGAFTNRNHFAQFLTLSLGPLLWWLVSEARSLFNGTATPASTFSFGRKQNRKKKTKRRELPPVQSPNANKFDRMISLPIVGLLAAVCLVGIAVLMSLSRGGMIALFSVCLISGLGLWRGLKMGSAAVVVVMGGSVLFLTLLAFTDQTELQTKIDQLLSSDADEIDSGGVRRAIWAADARIIRQFPWFGTGVGSHRDVYPLYMDNYADHASAVMTHAESSFVHLALETGLIGFGVLTVGLLLFLARLAVGYFGNSVEKQACTVIVLACAVGGILHGIVDFIWYAPAIVVTSLVLVAVGIRTSSRHFDTPSSNQGLWFPRMAWATFGGCCLIGLATVQADLFQRIDGEKHWYASLRIRLDTFDDDEEQLSESDEGDAIVLKEGVDLHLTPEEKEVDEAKLLARRITAQKEFLTKRIRHLAASLKAYPEQHRIQLAMAEQVIKLFDVLQIDGDLPFSLSMLRDAASSGFETVDELQAWLNNNCEGRAKLLLLASHLSKQSLSECPIQGYAYLNLMKVAFTEGQTAPDHQHLIDQALMVRGHDPRIRLAVGKEALVAGDQKRALDLFQTVFHSNQRFRLEIIQQWASGTHAEFFLAQFKPNGEELEDLLIVYDHLERERDANVILQRLVEVLPVEAPEIEDEDERLDSLMKAYGAARRLEQLETSVALLQTTIGEFPFAFEPRYHLGMTLVELERGDEAMEHLKWCYDQDPSHVYVQQQIERATRQKHALPKDEDKRISQL